MKCEVGVNGNELSCKQSTGDRDQSEAPLNVDQGISYLNEMRDASVSAAVIFALILLRSRVTQ